MNDVRSSLCQNGQGPASIGYDGGGSCFYCSSTGVFGSFTKNDSLPFVDFRWSGASIDATAHIVLLPSMPPS